MRPLMLILPLLASVRLALGQQSELLSAVALLPQCAQKCLGAAVQHSTCGLTNTTCICADMPLQAEVESCVLQSCTLRQALVTKNATATLCHAPVRYTGGRIRVSNIALAVVTAFCALARVIYKAIFSVGELGLDDYSVIITLIVGVPSVVIIDRGIVTNGLGRDVWTVPFNQITDFVRYLYACEILYFLQITLLKLTLLFFFLRIFPKPVIRRLLWGTITFTCLWGTASTITAIFQCSPISLYWNSWDKSDRPGKCININALAWSNAIISIVLDIWMLVLPLYEIFRLQLSWRKKISVAIMFCVGTFVTVVSILRLQSLVHFAASSNPTFDQTDVINWSAIEINVGVICSCLPSLRVILVRSFPRVFGTTRGTSEAYQGYGSRSQGIRNKSSTMASGIKKSLQTSSKDPNSITYTKTFEVQHGESDETSLVHMNELGPHKPKNHGSSSTSISSL